MLSLVVLLHSISCFYSFVAGEFVDGCSESNGDCQHECVPIKFGHRSCRCRRGYALHTNELDCIDIDECLWGNGGCSGTCINVEGSYYCQATWQLSSNDTSDLLAPIRGPQGLQSGREGTKYGYIAPAAAFCLLVFGTVSSIAAFIYRQCMNLSEEQSSATSVSACNSILLQMTPPSDAEYSSSIL